MDSIGSLVANELIIKNNIESYVDHPNVITIHPQIEGYHADTSNIIAIVDLAQQEFQIKNESELNSFWWLSYRSYCARCKSIFSDYILSDYGDKEEMDAIEDKRASLETLSRVIFSFICGTSYRLSSDDHIAELFIENHFATDSLIVFHTRSACNSANDFSFLTFSADNPYANIDKLQISKEETGKKEEEEEEEEEEGSHHIYLLRADIDNNTLHKWHSIAFPSVESPQSTSRESAQCVFNAMLKHWECRLSQNKRFLLIFPEKLGEIADVYLSQSGRLFWIQSLFGAGSNQTNQMNLRRVFSVNECNVRKQFECKAIKLLVSTEEAARFKLLPFGDKNVIIWNFSINGACNDLFTVIGAQQSDDYCSSNKKLNNKLCAIENAQNFSNYRFKSGDLRDLIRDVPKLCSLNGQIIFGGACFLSVLNDCDAIHVYDEESKRLITSSVSGAYSLDSWIPVKICEAKDSAKWITDYVPFKNESILARWNGDIGKSVYGIWKLTKENRWKCLHSKQYDDMKWNNAIMSCYHFGDRIKTILLAIELMLRSDSL